MRTGDWDVALDELEDALLDDWAAPDRMSMLGPMGAISALRGHDQSARLREIEGLMEPGLSDSLHAIDPFVVGNAAFAPAGSRRRPQRLRRPPRITGQTCRPRSRSGHTAPCGSGMRTGPGTCWASSMRRGLHGPAIEADRLTIRAGVAALEGRVGDALGLYREALRAWRDLGLAWDEALCAIDMATLLGPGDPEVREAAADAREILVRLEAAPFVERLDAAMAASPVQPSEVRTHA